MNNGAVFEAVEEHNRGSLQNPMTRDELLDKFERNAAGVLSATQIKRPGGGDCGAGIDSGCQRTGSAAVAE